MAVTVSGMFGNGRTYFADSPVVINISGLYWGNPVTSPFTVVRMNVIYDNKVVGSFHYDTGGQTTATFDISQALKAIWSDYDYMGTDNFPNEVLAAAKAKTISYSPMRKIRAYRSYSLEIYTEYLDSQDGEFVKTPCEDSDGNRIIPGGRCLMGWLTEMERYTIGIPANADASYWQGRNTRNGDASTKPSSSPELVGRNSITSWVDVSASGTTSTYYPPSSQVDQAAQESTSQHAPLVLRDDVTYTDFLFVNRRGAVETCSAQMLTQLGITTSQKAYGMTGRPSFVPERSLMSVRQGGPRRDWLMSSGYQTRDWADWWTTEFLTARRWWMWHGGRFVPVTVEPAKQRTTIYDKVKQELPHVDFTVTLGLEG